MPKSQRCKEPDQIIFRWNESNKVFDAFHRDDYRQYWNGFKTTWEVMHCKNPETLVSYVSKFGLKRKT